MKKFWDFFFHRHTFNPDKWTEIASYVYTRKYEQPEVIRGHEYVYTNTCLTCGTLRTKTVNTYYGTTKEN